MMLANGCKFIGLTVYFYFYMYNCRFAGKHAEVFR